MEAKSKRKVALVTGLVLVAASLAAQIGILLLGKGDAPLSVHIAKGILYIAAFLFAGIYIGTGFKKSSALFFRLFYYSFLLAVLLHIMYVLKFLSADLLQLLLHAAVFAILNILTFTKDLGKKKSLAFAYALLALTVVILGCDLLQGLVFANPPRALPRLLLDNTGKLTASAILVSTVHMKYIDKAERNTK